MSLGIFIGVALTALVVFYRYEDVGRWLGIAGGDTDRLQARIVQLESQLEGATSTDDAAGQLVLLRNELARKDEEIGKLEDQIGELLTGAQQARQNQSDDASAARAEADQLRARLELAQGVTSELQSQVDKAVNDEIPALEAELEKRDQALKAFDAEISRLADVEKQLEQLQGAQADDQANQQQAQQLRDDIAKRDAALAKLDAEVARLSSLERELAALRKERDDAGTDSAATQKALQDELDLTRRQAAQASEKAAEREAELAGVRNELAQRDTVLAQLDSEVTRLTSAETDLKAARDELAQLRSAAPEGERLQAKVSTLQAELKKLVGQFAATNRELDAKTAQIAALQLDLDQARAEERRLRAELAAASARPQAPADTTPAEPAPKAPSSGDREATPRDPLLVVRAMGEANGLDNLSNAQRDQLATGLIEGTCVSTVLTDVFGRAPAVTMRDLIQALDSDC